MIISEHAGYDDLEECDVIIGAAALAVVGAIGLVVGFVAKRRLDAMTATATVSCAEVGGVAGDDEARPCEVVGDAGANPEGSPGNTQEALVGPLSGTPCVWYRTTISRRYHDRRGDDSRDTTRARQISHQESPAPFAIRDASGVTTVFPEGASVIGESKTVDRFEPYIPGARQSGDGSLAERAVSIGLNLLTETDHGTIGYEYREWIIREGSRLYVRAGAMRDHTGRAWLQKPERGPFLISTKSEAALTTRSRLTMLIAFGAGAALLAGGLVLGVLALI
jgi:hypothetical protein